MDFFSDWENSPLFAWPVGIGWPAWSAWAVYGGSLFVVLTVLIVCISCCCCCCGGSTRRCCLPCRCSSCCQPNEYIANYAPPALENSGFKRGVSGRRLSGIDPDTPAAGTAGGSSSSGGGASTAHLNSSGGRKATASGEFAAPDNILQLIGGSAAVTPSINPIDEEPPALTRDNSLHGGGGGGYLGKKKKNQNTQKGGWDADVMEAMGSCLLLFSCSGMSVYVRRGERTGIHPQAGCTIAISRFQLPPFFFPASLFVWKML